MMKRFHNLLTHHPFLLGLTIRIAIALLLPALLDDGILLRGARYTDVDLDVFTDASDLVANGESPYGRHTYRYTPFLAALLSFRRDDDCGLGGFAGGVGRVMLGRKHFGRMLFCLADAACGSIIAAMRRRKRRRKRKKIGTQNDTDDEDGGDIADGLWWSYNPLPINICTRGSAESLVVLLPVLATVAVVLVGSDDDHDECDGGDSGNRGSKPSSRTKKTCSSALAASLRACLAGVFHGIGMHAKLYPVIYTVSFMAYLSRRQEKQQERESVSLGHHGTCDGGGCCSTGKKTAEAERNDDFGKFPWTDPYRLFVLATRWFQRLFLTRDPVLFLACAAITFAGLTKLAVQQYGREALEEGLMYHFKRVDHRHNYSMYWYWIYLARGRAEVGVAGAAAAATATNSLLGKIAPLAPQALLLGFSSLGLAPHDLPMALFVQTFAFVAFNKVVTAQYFLWYLCLLPLCADRIRWRSRRMVIALGLMGASVGTWLGCAYRLELLGLPVHRWVWRASLFFFLAKVNLLSAMIDGYRRKQAMMLEGAEKTKQA